MIGRSLVIVSVLISAGAVCGCASAQDVTVYETDINALIQRFEQLDKKEKDEGFVLENYKVEQQPGDPSPNTLKLSIGGFGPKPETPFEDRPKWSIDPAAPPEPRPFGFNLKMKF
jgi:hypothetical protein